MMSQQFKIREPENVLTETGEENNDVRMSFSTLRLRSLWNKKILLTDCHL